jgi:hypothetical protein
MKKLHLFLAVILLMILIGGYFLLSSTPRAICQNNKCEKGEALSCPRDCTQIDENSIGFSATIKEGFDWSLPPAVKPAEYSGLWYQDAIPDKPFIKVVGKRLSWSQLNPGENDYNFDIVKSVLQRAKENNIKVVFLLNTHVIDENSPFGDDPNKPYVPQWILDKYNPKEFFTKDSRSISDNQYEVGKSGLFIKVAAPWDEGIQREYKKLVEEFGRQGFFEDETLAGMYVHGFSTSYGEEFFLFPPYVEEAENAGMNDERLYKTYTERLDWWANAAGKNVYKIAWVGMFGIYSWDNKNNTWIENPNYPKTHTLDKYALDLGMGWRGGAIEGATYRNINPPFLGQNIANNYLITDWNHPLRSEKRYFGEEAEQPPRKTYENGKKIPEEYRKMQVEAAIIRSAQIGFNFLWTSREYVDIQPELMEWWTLIAGKNATEAPDAIAFLLKNQEGINNIEHFLYQRDFSDTKTKPVLKIEGEKKEIYISRSTDVKNNQKLMLFFIDPEFKKNLSIPFEIKVTYFDNSINEWNIEVPNHDALSKSKTIKGINDGKWKTVTFEITQNLNNADSVHNSDFSLNVLSGGDLTVKFVRVIKK